MRRGVAYGGLGGLAFGVQSVCQLNCRTGTRRVPTGLPDAGQQKRRACAHPFARRNKTPTVPDSSEVARFLPPSEQQARRVGLTATYVLFFNVQLPVYIVSLLRTR